MFGKFEKVCTGIMGTCLGAAAGLLFYGRRVGNLIKDEQARIQQGWLEDNRQIFEQEFHLCENPQCPELGYCYDECLERLTPKWRKVVKDARFEDHLG